MAWNGTVTNLGIELLQQWTTSGATLVIDGAKTGEGTVPVSQLMGQSDVAGTSHSAGIAGKTIGDGQVTYNVQIEAAASAYTAMQIGIFAHVGNNASMLLALYQAEAGSGISVYAESEMPEFSTIFDAIVQMSTDGNLQVTIDSSLLVNRGQFDAGLALKIDKEAVANNLTTTEAGKVLDARQGKALKELVEQSTAWSNNWLTDTSILAYAASVANPSFTTFRTNATSTDVPIANEYYIGTVERYGQNITVKMTTMQDASKMYINNSVNGGSTWTGWKTFLDSQSAKTVDSGVLATYTYGTLRYRLLTNFGIAQIIWSGNANIPDETTVNVSLPDKLKPETNCISVMRNGDAMEVRNETTAGALRLTFGSTPKAWSGASITYIP